jgi:hypothetical protein
MKNLLLKISHADFTLSLAGPLPVRDSYALSRVNNTLFETVLFPVLLKGVDVINSSTFCKIEAVTLNPQEAIQISYLSKDAQGNPLPIFFEHVEYTVLLKNNYENGIELWHEDKSLISGISEFDENIFSGSLNFRSNVGETIFLIKKGGVAFLKLTFTVYSTKLDFFAQRKVMLTEVQKIHNSVLYELFKPTKESASTSNVRITGIEWLTLFYQSSDYILKLVRRIEAKSHSKLHTQAELKPTAKLKGSNRMFLKQVRKHGFESVSKTRKVWSDKKVITNDTAENRYIKFLLHQLVRTGRKWVDYIEKNNNPRNKQLLQSEYFFKLKTNVQLLSKLLKNRFWSSIKLDGSVLQNRGNFGFHHEFIKAEQISRKLKRGLVYDVEGTERVYVMSMDLLYQMWTYLKIADIISLITQFKRDGIKLKAEPNDFQTSILTGKPSKVEVATNFSIQTERLFTEISNPYRVPLVNQKPDIILELLHKQELILFDAKYKVNIYIKIAEGKYESLSNKDLITKPINGREVFIEPVDEDINVIHRYKDAIYLNQTHNYKHVVLKGFILFPGLISSESLSRSKSSTRSFGVGYLPFTPGEIDTDWFSQYPFDFDRSNRMLTSEDVRAVAEALYETVSSPPSLV